MNAGDTVTRIYSEPEYDQDGHLQDQTWDYPDYIDYVEQAPTVWGTGKHRAPSDGWVTGTWDDAQKWASYGWPEGLDRLDDISAGLPDVGGVRLSRIAYDYVGARPSVAHYAAGDPQCMVRMRRSRHRPVATIRACAVYHWGVKPAELANWALGLVSLIDSLENAGLQCELMASIPVKPKARKAPTFNVNVMVRKVGQPVDLDRLMFVFGHPAFLRRYWFGLMESDQKYFDALGAHYGTTDVHIDQTSADLTFNGVELHRDIASDTERCAAWFRDAGAVLALEGGTE